MFWKILNVPYIGARKISLIKYSPLSNQLNTVACVIKFSVSYFYKITLDKVKNNLSMYVVYSVSYYEHVLCEYIYFIAMLLFTEYCN